MSAALSTLPAYPCTCERASWCPCQPGECPSGPEAVLEPSDERGAWTCGRCGFRGFWSGGPHDCASAALPVRPVGVSERADQAARNMARQLQAAGIMAFADVPQLQRVNRDHQAGARGLLLQRAVDQRRGQR